MPNKRKRVLIFSVTYHPVIQGAEDAVKELTDRMPELDFELVTQKFSEEHPAEERIGNVKVHRINAPKILYAMYASMYAKELHAVKPFNAVWSIMASHAGFASLYFKDAHPEVPYILSLQEGKPLEYIKRRTFFISPIFKKVFTRADKVHAISEYLGDWAEVMGYGGEKVVIPNGVDIEVFKPQMTKKARTDFRDKLGFEKDDEVLITTSRLVEKNAIWDIIRALPMLTKNTKLLVVGSGPESKGLRKLAHDLGVGERVNFVGHVRHEEVPPYLHASDIFIRPSLAEGFGNSFIEAFAAELPVIGTQIGGLTDFIHDPDHNGKIPPTGLFVNTRDPEYIAKQVRRLVKDEKLKKTLVRNAKKLVAKKYEWNLVAQEMKSRIFDKV